MGRSSLPGTTGGGQVPIRPERIISERSNAGQPRRQKTSESPQGRRTGRQRQQSSPRTLVTTPTTRQPERRRTSAGPTGGSASPSPSLTTTGERRVPPPFRKVPSP